MTRRLVLIGSAYGLGLMACAFAPQSQFPVILILCAVPAYLLLRRQKPDIRAFAAVTAYLCGCLLWTGYMALCVNPLLALDGQRLPFSGKIIQVDDSGSDTARYVIRGRVDGRRATIISYGTAYQCEEGDEISFTAEFSVLSDTYLFPAATYYASEGIYLTATQVEEVSVTAAEGVSISGAVRKYREQILSQIRQTMPSREAGLLCAMLCGEDAGLDSASQTALYRTGIGHITAVSGLHLSLICAALAAILKRLRAGKFVEFSAIALLISLFVLFAEGTNSVLRAGIMLLLVYGARITNRRADTLNSLCAALLLITLAAPYAVKSASFLLSFSATFAISVLAPYLTSGIPDKRLRSLAAMSCVTVAVLPVSVLFFDETSTIAPIANLVILPLCMLALVCGLLFLAVAGIGFLADAVLSAAQLLCTVVLEVADFCARLPFSHLPLGYSAYRVLIPALALGVIAVFAFTRQKKPTAVAFVTAAMVFLNCAFAAPLAEMGKTRIALLGEGDACTVVVISDGKAEVLDFSGGNKGAEYAARYLSDLGIDEIALICLYDRPLTAIPAYDSVFSYKSVSSLCVAEDAVLTDGLSLCGCTPERADSVQIASGDCQLSCSQDGTARLTAGGMAVWVGPQSAQPADCGVIAVYRTDSGDVTIRTPEHTISGTNLECIISSAGRVTVRRL